MFTIIEFFDRDPLENVISLLMLKPDKVIFLGNEPLFNDNDIKNTESFIKRRLPEIKTEYIKTERYNFDGISTTLKNAVNSEDCCMIDLTGGKELFLVCAGITAKEHNVPMFHIDIANQRFIPVHNCEGFIKLHNPVLSVHDYILLNGGAINDSKQEYFKRNFSEEIFNDINLLWSFNASDPSKWNSIVKALEETTKLGSNSPADISVNCNIYGIYEKCRDEFYNNQILNNLISDGFITDFLLNPDGQISFKYKNAFTKSCLTEAGSILELYTYVTAKSLNYYDDVMVGVPINWEGNLQKGKFCADTTNEMDLILTKGVKPVFISCKNGFFEKEALYELDVVATRFGGKYVKKVLAAAMPPENSPKYAYLQQRAKEMNIELIDGISQMKTSEYKRLIGKFINQAVI